MPSITVSDHVLELIRSLKQTGETTEEETLRRILAVATAEKKRRLRAYESTDQDIQSTN